jgi:hypothetical protein
MTGKDKKQPAYATQLQKHLERINEEMEAISNLALINEVDDVHVTYVDDALKKMLKLVLKNMRLKRERVELSLPPIGSDSDEPKEKAKKDSLPAAGTSETKSSDGFSDNKPSY